MYSIAYFKYNDAGTNEFFTLATYIVKMQNIAQVTYQ